MEDTMITVAYYEDRRLAQHHAELLQNRGLHCQLVEEPLSGQLTGLLDQEGEYLIQVPESQLSSATDWLDQLASTPLYEPSGEGDTLVLIGAVLAMVGILTSFGEIGDITGDILFLPYALAFVGGALFFRGLMVNREAEAEED